MYINKIIVYDYSYAEYLVTDGVNDLLCMCLSVPLPNNETPKINMKVSNIFVFSYNDIYLKKVDNDNKKQDVIFKDNNDYFKYILRGHILNKSKAIVEVFNFRISLENYFPEGFDDTYKKNDYVEFIADRLDCIIDTKIYNN